MSEKFVVTGGAGFIGSHIVDALVEEGHEVVVLDNLSTGREGNVNPAARLVHMDLVEPIDLGKTFKGAAGVFHVAALPRIQPSFMRPMEHHRANIDATLNVLAGMEEAQCRRLVYSSSSSCYGNPTEFPTTENAKVQLLNPYALQKFASEQYALLLAERYSIRTVALRYFNVYGPRSFNPDNPDNAYSSVIGIFKHHSSRGGRISVTGSGNQKRDFVHVKDVARANLMAMRSDIEADVFNVGGGNTQSINDVAALFADEWDYIEERKGEAEITWASIDKIRNGLGWKPVITIDAAIRDSLL